MPVTVVLTQVQWHSVRARGGPGLLHLGDRAQGDGGRPLAGHDHGRAPRPCTCPSRPEATSSCGRRRSDAEGRDDDDATSVLRPRRPATRAWERYDHNRIDLVPERKTYRPGESRAAHDQVAVGERARAAHHRARRRAHAPHASRLTSTQQTVTVPITERRHPQRLRLRACC